VDLKMPTKDGKTAEDVAVEEGADASFVDFLRECVRRQSVQELVSAARDGEWKAFHALLASSGVTAADLNAVPAGRIWGVIHQVCGYSGVLMWCRLMFQVSLCGGRLIMQVSYWGEESVLQSLLSRKAESGG
jgi:hypothetical protein